MKQILTFIITVVVSHQATAQMPTRKWGDDMPSHSFSLTVGPAWALNAFGALDIPRWGYEAELRYGWAFTSNEKSSLGIGLTYVFSSFSSRDNKVEGSRSPVKLYEALHVVGFNASDLKVRFGDRLIWTITMSLGYIGGVSWIEPDFPDNKVKKHGLMTGFATGFGYLITPSLGIETNLNFIYGLMSGSTLKDEFMHYSVRLGAVYCF